MESRKIEASSRVSGSVNPRLEEEKGRGDCDGIKVNLRRDLVAVPTQMCNQEV